MRSQVCTERLQAGRVGRRIQNKNQVLFKEPNFTVPTSKKGTKSPHHFYRHPIYRISSFRRWRKRFNRSLDTCTLIVAHFPSPTKSHGHLSSYPKFWSIRYTRAHYPRSGEDARDSEGKEITVDRGGRRVGVGVETAEWLFPPHFPNRPTSMCGRAVNYGLPGSHLSFPSKVPKRGDDWALTMDANRVRD